MFDTKINPLTAESTKIGHTFGKLRVWKLELTKNFNNKSCSPQFLFVNEKQSWEDSDDLCHKICLWISTFAHFEDLALCLFQNTTTSLEQIQIGQKHN